MKAFACEGVWWLPGTRERVGGTLRSERDGTTTLSVAKDFDATRTGQTVEVIYGLVPSCPGGSQVTLAQCRPAGMEVAIGGYRSARYRANALYAGVHLAKTEFEFTATSFDFSGLGAWAHGLTGLPRSLHDVVGPGNDHNSDPSFRYVRPAMPTAQTGEARIGLDVGCGVSLGGRRAVFEEYVLLHADFKRPLSPSAIVHGYLAPLQNLLTLACDGPNAVKTWRVEQGVQQAEVRMPWTYTQVKPGGGDDFMPLFRLEHVGPRFGDMVCRWLACHERMPAVHALYFGMQYSRPAHSDTRLQVAAQALTLYANAKGVGKVQASDVAEIAGLLESADAAQRAALDKLLSGNLALAAEAALTWFLPRHWDAFAQIAGKSVAEFRSRTVAALDYIQRRDSTAFPAEDWGEGLHFMAEQLQWLMKLCFLEELGFSEGERARLVKDNPWADFFVARAGKRRKGR